MDYIEKLQTTCINEMRVNLCYLIGSQVSHMEISDVYWKDTFIRLKCFTAAAAAKSLQSCPTLCDPIDGSPPGSSIPGILQARILEWVAISFSSAWKWKVKVKLLSRAWILVTPWTAAYQGPPSMGFSRQECWSEVPLPSPKCFTNQGNIEYFFRWSM